MSSLWPEPNEQNAYMLLHVRILLHSFTQLTGRTLIDPALPLEEQARQLFYAPFVVLSHTPATDPIFNYGNRAALTLFEFTWDELIRLPSRLSAEPLGRDERAHLLATVARQGYIDDYHGVRIAKSGRRFIIEQAMVWNLIDDQQLPYGQAATFGSWTFV